MKPGADRADIQEAAWAIMDPANYNGKDTTVNNYLEAAYLNYSSFEGSGYSIISDVDKGCKQEFIVASPEPATFALFGGGLLAAGAARLLRRRKQTMA